MDVGFAIICSLARHRRPQIQFLSIGSRVCSTLLSDLTSRFGPCASLSLHLHLVVKRTCTSQLSDMLGTQNKTGVHWKANARFRSTKRQVMSNRVQEVSSRPLAACSAAYLAASVALAAVFAVISAAPGRVFARAAGVVAAVSVRLAVFESLQRSSAESSVAPEPASARLSGAPDPASGGAAPVAAAVSERPAGH